MEHKQPSIQEDYSFTGLGNGIYNISAPPVGFQQYLILGTQKALLIDTGIGIGSIREVVSKITALPVTVINTHCHPDHAGGNAEFEPALINPAELDVFEQMATLEFRSKDVARMPGGSGFIPRLQPAGPAPVFAQDMQHIGLGGRSVQILFTPGHTHGSLCVYDEETGALFTGDNVQAGTTALCEWNSGTVEDLYRSLLRLSSLPITRILTGHRPNDNPPELLEWKTECARQILDGAPGTPAIHMGTPGLIHEYHGTSILYLETNIRGLSH